MPPTSIPKTPLTFSPSTLIPGMQQSFITPSRENGAHGEWRQVRMAMYIWVRCQMLIFSGSTHNKERSSIWGARARRSHTSGVWHSARIIGYTEGLIQTANRSEEHTSELQSLR